jgi:hypothetical protein
MPDRIPTHLIPLWLFFDTANDNPFASEVDFQRYHDAWRKECGKEYEAYLDRRNEHVH